MTTVQNLPNLIISSSGSLFSAGIGNLDDAEAITIFLSTAAAALLLVPTIQISQFNPALSTNPGSQNVAESTMWYATTDISTFTVGGSITISPVNFRGLRVATSAGSSVLGTTVIAYATKQIAV